MGSWFSSLSSVSSIIFPAPPCSYTWEFPNLITIPRKEYNELFFSSTICAKKMKVIPTLYFGTPLRNSYRNNSNSLRNSYRNNENSLISNENQTCIIYSHGNGEDIGQCYEWLKLIHTNLNVNVLAYDYEGYGLHFGSPSENACYRDIKNVFEYYFLLFFCK